MNDSRITQPSQALDHALEMSALGYKIIPIPTGQKFPKGLAEWQKKATNDRDQIIHWWGSGEAGIGWAMGMQPNGTGLVAVDVDVADGKPGKANFEAFVQEHDFSDALRNTVMSVTGSGGFHFIFALPDGVELTNGILLPGVDIRGEGGFIVVPPSIHPNGKAYRWAREGSAPWSIAPAACPEAVIRQLSPSNEQDDGDQDRSNGDNPYRVHAPSVPRGTSEQTPADFIREHHLSIAEMLHAAGWSYVESKGNDEFWCRPGKNPRDGHSAVLHDDGPLVIWSTSAPMEFWRVGRDNPDGSRSLSPFEVYAAIEHAGDIRAAASYIRRQLMSASTASVLRSPVEATPVAPTQATPLELNLPDEFWTARPWLTHVRDAAWSRFCSPDAVLIGVLARFAALVPATLRIPPMVGSDATFDFIGCVVASSSGGKTVSNDVAEELIVTQRTDVMMGRPIGSGEGLVQAFMVPELDGDGKKTGKQTIVNGPRAIYFTVDESTALIAQHARQGTTIVQTMCSAWSGAVLGSMGAAAETHRYIPKKQRRVSCVMNMQTANGYRLLEEHIVAIGLPQRIVFSWAHDRSLPKNPPEWPGELWHPQLPIVVQPHVLEYDPEIVSAVRGERWSVATENLVLGDTEGHQTLQRLKLAGLIELLSDGQVVSWETWELAGMIMTSSTAIKNHLLNVKKQGDYVRGVTRDTARAMSEVVVQEVKDRQHLARLREKIKSTVTEDGISKSALSRSICSSGTDHLFEEALTGAIEDGAVRLEPGRKKGSIRVVKI